MFHGAVSEIRLNYEGTSFLVAYVPRGDFSSWPRRQGAARALEYLAGPGWAVVS
jgi:hypothetical protein